jgi:hypothetical protein
LPAECVVPCGIPVCGGFSSVSPDEAPALRERFGLERDGPLVLAVSHGLGPELLAGALLQLSLCAERAAPGSSRPGGRCGETGFLFDVARDDEGAELLRRRAGLYGVRAQMFGKVDEAAQLWGACSLVVARPHVYVEQRALALRLPLIALEPGEGAELEAARVWAGRQIGRCATRVSTLAAELELALAPGWLAAARQRIGEVSRRSAATDVARLVAQVRADAERVLAEARARAPQPSVAATPEPARRGPLEAIGEAESHRGTPAELDAATEEAQRLVTEHQLEVARWSRRAELAAERGEQELEAVARRRLEQQQRAMHAALAELARLAELRRGRDTRAVEQDFRKLELDEALAALKRKLE